jgi:hypothetical protein
VQKQDVNLSVVVSLLQSLHLFTSELRDEFSGFELKAKAIATDANYADTTCRKRKRSILITRFEGAASETVLTGREKFRLDTYVSVIDSLCQAGFPPMKLFMNCLVSSWNCQHWTLSP